MLKSTRSLILPLLLLLPLPLSGQEQRNRIQIPPQAVSGQAEMRRIVEQGRKLETERRWQDALRYYEDALEQNPGQTALEQRLSVVKTQLDITRRYADSSFRESLETIDRRAAVRLYGEVLQKLEAYYYAEPNWSRLVDRGVGQLRQALGNGRFRSAQRREYSDEELRRLISELQSEFSHRLFRSRSDTQWAADYSGYMAERRLGVSGSAVVFEFISASSGLDDYSAFLTPSQLDEIFSQIEGNFVGLGIELKPDQETLLIVHVIPGGPAEEAGLQAGDRIVAVEGQSTQGSHADVAADRLKGPEGSVAEIEVRSEDGSVKTLHVERRRVEVPSVERVRLLDPETGLAYFRLTSFQKTTTRDVDAALWQLHREGMKSLVIDLRGNPGGLLPAAVELADKFLSRGLIVSTRGRSQGEDNDYRAHQAGTWRMPLYVLIDGDSASASEIFAGAIRDSGRGTVVGQRSYGKGSVQGIFPLAGSRAGLRLTTAKFFSPSGQPISQRGVDPHVKLQQVARPAADRLPETDGDPAITAVLELARQRLASR